LVLFPFFSPPEEFLPSISFLVSLVCKDILCGRGGSGIGLFCFSFFLFSVGFLVRHRSFDFVCWVRRRVFDPRPVCFAPGPPPWSFPVLS